MSIYFKSSTPIRTMKPISLALALAAVSIFSQTSQAKLADAPSQEDMLALQESVINLEESLSDIQSQYQELYNLLNKAETSSQTKLTNLSSLFQENSTNSPVTVSGNTITIRDDASIYLGDQKLLDVIKSWTKSEQTDNQTQSAGFSSMSGASFMAAPTVSYSEFQNVANTVLALNTRISTAEKDIKTISASVAEIKKSQNSTEELLTEALGELEVKVNSLQDTIVEGENGGFSSTVSSVEIPDPPAVRPVKYQSWMGGYILASSFRVSKEDVLESVTLYFENSSQIADCYEVHVTCEDYSWRAANATSRNTADKNRPVYYFGSDMPKLKPGKDYYLVVESPDVGTCERYRGNGIYSVEKIVVNSISAVPAPSGSDPKYGDYMDIRERSLDNESEIWSKITMKQETSMTFSESGLDIGQGQLTVAGSKVITESSLRSAVKSELKATSGAFNGSLTYGMFNNELKDMFIKRTGGTMTGNLTVEGQVILPNKGAWNVGTESAPSDLVIVNSSSTIRSQNGNLNIAAKGGDIVAESFVQHSEIQCGQVEVGGNSASIEISGITKNAVVMLTPMQETKQSYWYQVNEDTHTLLIYKDASSAETVKFAYFVIRK